MESFLDTLKAAQNSPQVKINVILTSFKPNERKIYIFLEGRDDPSFFRVHVTRIADSLNLEVTTTILGKKKDVLNAWNFFEGKYPNNPRLIFFVDKDHDDLTGNAGSATEKGLFVTSCYSIENFLVSANTVKLILIDNWGLDSFSRAIESTCERFERFQNEYRSVFLPWMAWLVAVRRLGGHPLNNNVLRKIFTLSSNYEPILNWQPDMSTYLSSKCNISSPPDTESINLAIQELQVLPTKVWLRGKQELWCLLAFIQQLEEDVKNNPEIKGIKIRTQINTGNAIESIAPRIPCPKELSDYLSQRLANI